MAPTPSLPVLATIFVIITVAINTWQICRNESFILKMRPPFETVKETIINKESSYMHVPKRRKHTAVSYDVNSLPSWDFTRLVNMSKFTFLLENTVCNESEPLDLLVLIHTAPKNVEKRNAVRETWGQPRKGMKVLFLLGGVDSQDIQESLDAEDRKYHDLVQGNFMDAYKNLTYKHVMAFKYAVYYCSTAKFILKTDDDVFVNIPTVLGNITELPKEKQTNLIWCSIMDWSPAIRHPSKWQVPFNEYPHKFFPTYCSGFAVIYSYDVVFRIYREAQRGEYHWVDDAFVSGTLAKRINIKHMSLPQHFLMNEIEMNKFITSKGLEAGDDFWVGPLNIDSDSIRKLWHALMNRIVQNRVKLFKEISSTTKS